MSDESQVVDELAQQIGSRIRAFREEHGLTQTDFAERIGIARQQIGRYESGFEVPSTRIAMAIANFMDVSVHELLYGNHDEDIRISDPQLRERFVVIDRMPAHERRAALDLLEMFILSRRGFARESQK